MARPPKSLIAGADLAPQSRSFTMSPHQTAAMERAVAAMLKERGQRLAHVQQLQAAVEQELTALAGMVDVHARALATAAKLRYPQAQLLLQAHVPKRAAAAGGRLAPAQVAEIRRALAAGESGRALARLYNVSEMAISRIRAGKTYTG